MERIIEMKRAKAITRSAPSDDAFRQESVASAETKIQSESEFFEEFHSDLENALNGNLTEPVVTIAFESVAAFLEVVTPRRNELLQTVRKNGTFGSIEELAIALNRNRAAVSRDLRALCDIGLLRVKEAIHSGHGRRSEVSPTAEKFVFSFSL